MDSPFRIVEAKPGQVLRECEHRALDGDVMVARCDVLGRRSEQEPGDDHVEGLGEDFLSDAERRLGAELTLVEVRGLRA